LCVWFPNISCEQYCSFFGEKHLNETIKLDYFAVSLPDLLIWEDDLTFRNKIHCHYMIGLGNFGLGKIANAKTHLPDASKMYVNYQGVHVHLSMINEHKESSQLSK
jgi:hypothetical protein